MRSQHQTVGPRERWEDRTGWRSPLGEVQRHSHPENNSATPQAADHLAALLETVQRIAGEIPKHECLCRKGRSGMEQGQKGGSLTSHRPGYTPAVQSHRSCAGVKVKETVTCESLEARKHGLGRCRLLIPRAPAYRVSDSKSVLPAEGPGQTMEFWEHWVPTSVDRWTSRPGSTGLGVSRPSLWSRTGPSPACTARPCSHRRVSGARERECCRGTQGQGGCWKGFMSKVAVGACLLTCPLFGFVRLTHACVKDLGSFEKSGHNGEQELRRMRQGTRALPCWGLGVGS